MRRFLEYGFMTALVFTIAWMMCGCTFTINLVHTMGMAEDLIDDVSTPTAHTEVTIPVKAI